MDEDIDMDNEKKITITDKIFPVFHTIHKPYVFSQAEARIKNDLIELQNKRLTTGKFDIKISPYSLKDNGKDFIMYVEFKELFKIQIIFLEEYPFVPPLISYVSGKYFDNLFDMENNLKLNCLSIDKWSPVLDLNSILFSIELKMDDKGSINVNRDFYRKRKFFEYKNMFDDDNDINIDFTEDKLKRLKI